MAQVPCGGGSSRDQGLVGQGACGSSAKRGMRRYGSRGRRSDKGLKFYGKARGCADFPAFALHAEPLRRKFYRPKSVLVHSFTQSGSICPIRSHLLAQARTYLCVDWVYERASFGGDFVKRARLNFIRRRLVLVRFIRHVSANLARAMPALVRSACTGFLRTRRHLHASRRGFRRIL